MIIQDIYLEKYDWYIRVYYDIDKTNSNQILEDISSMNCSEDEFINISRFLNNIKENSGITYSNPEDKISLIAISYTTCAMEFQDTLDHEKGHLATHISITNNIDPFGEEYQYLVGTIGRKMFPISKLFLCDNCRRG